MRTCLGALGALALPLRNAALLTFSALTATTILQGNELLLCTPTLLRPPVNRFESKLEEPLAIHNAHLFHDTG